MILNKSQILAANDLGLLEVPVPEWGGSVYLRVMTVGERDAFELEWNGTDGKVDDFRSKFLARCLADDQGRRLFTDAELHLLAGKSAKVMSRLWKAAVEHNNLDEPAIQEAAKN